MLTGSPLNTLNQINHRTKLQNNRPVLGTSAPKDHNNNQARMQPHCTSLGKASNKVVVCGMLTKQRRAFRTCLATARAVASN